jgi:hypothetical protein
MLLVWWCLVIGSFTCANRGASFFPPTPSYTYSLTLGNFSQHCKLRKFPIFPRLAGRVNEEFVQEDSEGFGTSKSMEEMACKNLSLAFPTLNFQSSRTFSAGRRRRKIPTILMWRCEGEEWERQREREDVWRCAFVRMWRCEVVSMWRCEDVSMWRCEFVKMW